MEVIKCTPLCTIPETHIKCRHKPNESTLKDSAVLVKYSRGLVVVVDDCEGGAATERVWPKDAGHVMVVKAYDSLEASHANPRVLDDARHALVRTHQEFYRGVDDMTAELSRKNWLEVALNRSLKMPRIDELLLRHWPRHEDQQGGRWAGRRR